MGPLLCARVAGEMATAHAIDIARHLKPEFLARAAVHLETQRACELTAALPIERVAAVAQELIRRREYIVLGELVDTLPLSIVQAILPAIDDGEALLRSAFFLEHTGRIADMLAVLPEPTLHAVIRTAAAEDSDLWPHALALMSSVPEPWQRRLVELALRDDEATLGSMVRGGNPSCPVGCRPAPADVDAGVRSAAAGQPAGTARRCRARRTAERHQ